MAQFKVGENISYPGYGVGSVTNLYSEQIGDNMVDYIEISFSYITVEISIPVDKAVELGLRYLNKPKDIKKSLQILHQEVELTPEITENYDSYIKERTSTGKFDDVICIINLLVQKKKEKTKLSFTDSTTLKTSYRFVGTEVEYVLGEGQSKKYGIPKIN